MFLLQSHKDFTHTYSKIHEEYLDIISLLYRVELHKQQDWINFYKYQ